MSNVKLSCTIKINYNSKALLHQWTAAMRINFTYIFIAKSSLVVLSHCTGLVSIHTIVTMCPLFDRELQFITHFKQTHTFTHPHVLWHLHKCTNTHTHAYTRLSTHRHKHTLFIVTITEEVVHVCVHACSTYLCQVESHPSPTNHYSEQGFQRR